MKLQFDGTLFPGYPLPVPLPTLPAEDAAVATFNCPDCKERFQAPDALSRRRPTCPRCNRGSGASRKGPGAPAPGGISATAAWLLAMTTLCVGVVLGFIAGQGPGQTSDPWENREVLTFTPGRAGPLRATDLPAAPGEETGQAETGH